MMIHIGTFLKNPLLKRSQEKGVVSGLNAICTFKNTHHKLLVASYIMICMGLSKIVYPATGCFPSNNGYYWMGTVSRISRQSHKYIVLLRIAPCACRTRLHCPLSRWRHHNYPPSGCGHWSPLRCSQWSKRRPQMPSRASCRCGATSENSMFHSMFLWGNRLLIWFRACCESDVCASALWW